MELFVACKISLCLLTVIVSVLTSGPVTSSKTTVLDITLMPPSKWLVFLEVLDCFNAVLERAGV